MVEHGLLDHLVSASEYRLRDRQPGRFRGLEVDDKLEFGGLLHRQVTGLGSLQDAVDVIGGAPERVSSARGI